MGQEPVQISFENNKKSKHFIDSTQASLWVQTYILKKQNKGFGRAYINYQSSNIWYVNLGEKYNIHAYILDGQTIKKEGVLQQYPNPLLTIVREKANAGYPFYRIITDSIIVEDQGITIHATSRDGAKIYAGEVSINQPVLIKPNVFKRLSHWKTGKAFNYNNWNKLNSQLTSLPYITLKKPSSISFTGDSAHLHVELEKKRSNQFDVIIGFQPNNTTNKTEIIADVNLQLFNIAKRTDSWLLKWSTPEKNTQKLNASATIPFLLGTPFGYYLNVDLLKQDSTYLKTNIKNGLVFKPSFSSTIIVYIGKKNINPIGENELNISTVSNRFYGLIGQYQNLNAAFNPTKGINVSVDVSQGIQKKSLNDQQYANQTFLADGKVIGYIPVYRKFVIQQKIIGGYLVNKEKTNEGLLEVGGFSSFRGINERFIQTPSYAYYSFNPRFLLDRNSFLEVFTDQLWFSVNNTTHYYWSLGAGFAFSTKGGIFNINYAVANTGNGFLPKDGKIHFGYINVF